MGDVSGDDNAWRPPRAMSPPPEEIQGYADLVEIGRGGHSVVSPDPIVTVGRPDPRKVTRNMA